MAGTRLTAQADLTVYLLREGTSVETVLRRRDALEHYTVAVGMMQGELYVQRSRAPAPRWARFFRTQINPETFGAISSVSAILLVSVAGRIFALTFGHGRLLLADACWEDRFGLKIALNSVGNKIRSLDKQTLDSLGRHARIQSSRDAGVMEFGIDIEQDLLRAVTGRPADDRIGSRVTGMDGLRTTARVELHTLPALLRRLLETSRERTYKRHFPWIDHVREVVDETRLDELDDALAQRLDDDRTEGLGLAVPVIIDWNDVSVFRYHGVGDKLDHVELRLRDAMQLFHERFDTFRRNDLRRCRVSAVDADGTSKHAWSLHQCLHGELSVAGETYVLSAGRWFRVHKNFAKEVDDAFHAMPTLVRTTFPPYADSSEQAYCQRVADEDDDWILMDRKPIRYGGGRSQVEFCDLFRPAQQQLVHVKRYAGSGPLSHLFAQALVSGETFRVEPAFRIAVNALLPKAHRLPTKRAPEGFSIVLGIAKPDALTLPFFAKVALRHAVRRLGGYGYRVFLTHIVVSDRFALTKRARHRRESTGS